MAVARQFTSLLLFWNEVLKHPYPFTQCSRSPTWTRRWRRRSTWLRGEGAEVPAALGEEGEGRPRAGRVGRAASSRGEAGGGAGGGGGVAGERVWGRGCWLGWLVAASW
jgi:hypothetical protein